MALIQGRTVLIVDRSRDNREVLRAVLESAGLRTVEARRPEQARMCAADLVVLDAEEGDCEESSEDGAADGRWPQVPRVVLGRAKRCDRPETAADAIAAGRCYLPKPYHYGELIRAIEAMLAGEQCSAGAV